MINLLSGPSGITKDPEVAPLLNRETSRADIRKQQKRENWENWANHENTKDEKRENHENHENHENQRSHENRENAKTARSAKTAKTGKRQNRGEESIAHNCLLHFQALSASFCFSIFSCSRFSWFSPVFSCLCISSFWPRRANFLLRLCEPALISPPQQ